MGKIKGLFTKENIIKGLKWFFFSYIWLAVLLFIVDIVSKTVVKANMHVGQTIPLIPNFLSIQYVQNNGMAFGIDFKNQTANTVVFILVSVIGAILLTWFAVKYWKTWGQVGKASLMLMISGTIGNLIDRAFYVDNVGNHFVVDFIAFDFFGWPFPRFNVADSCLVIGTIMLLVYLIVMDFKESKKEKAQENVLSDEQMEKVITGLNNSNENNIKENETCSENKEVHEETNEVETKVKDDKTND